MKARCLNKVILIGNVTRQPEIKKTNNNSSVCNFDIITDREWETAGGEVKQESTKHSCVAWGKLAEICGQLLAKGSLVYIEGRLQVNRVSLATVPITEVEETRIVVEDMIMLKRGYDTSGYKNEA